MPRSTHTKPVPPPGWPVASSPLCIALLGWARLELQAREGSGYNLSASELAAGLALSGHRVVYLRSGMDYSLSGRPHVREIDPWRGVSCFDFYNSRNLSPAFNNLRNMRWETSSPADARAVIGWLDHTGAQIVHVHSLEGYPLDLIGAIRATGRPVVVTPHNYWYVCPQVDLLREELEVCMDYDGGRRCVGCLPSPHPGRARLKRSLNQSAHRLLGGFWAGTARSLLLHAKHRAASLVRRKKAADDVARESIQPGPACDPELARGFDASSTSGGGLIEQGYRLEKGEDPPAIVPSPIDQNERFLRADRHLVVLNEYGSRRRAGVDALNQASIVTPPSRFLLDAMRAMGVRPERLRLVRLGQPHFDQINRKTRRSPYYSVRPWDTGESRRPLRFAFLGTTRNNKGLEVLVRAIPRLPRAVRQRSHFLVRAAGWDWPLRKRLSAYPEVSFVGGYDTLQLLSLMDEFDVGVLPHIWFENSPLVMLEFLHAGKFILSSRLGGPPGWIVEPGASDDAPLGNGLLFPAGDDAALADAIRRVVEGDITLPSPREIHHASPTLQTYPGHVAEVEGIYRSLLETPAPEPKMPADAEARLVGVPDQE